MKPINILVTLDENYIPPLRTMIKSLFINNMDEKFHIYFIHNGISGEIIDNLGAYCTHQNTTLYPIEVKDEMFADAPVVRYFPKAMYYRLLACKLLPDTLDKVLYLDPDTLIINPIRTLYDTKLTGYLFAGCIHTGLTGLAEPVNKIRLGTYDTTGYFNSGVLHMNLEEQRDSIREEDIHLYVTNHKHELVLPDQNILNSLYGKRIKPLDDSLYNYAANHYETYRMVSSGEKNMDWIMANTVILHFCGKNRPWLKQGSNRFKVLYKHYAAIADRENEKVRRN